MACRSSCSVVSFQLSGREGSRDMRILRACILCLCALLLPRLANAGCSPIAQGVPRVIPADAAPDTLTITFLGHASFLIETPGGVRAVTDYNGINVPSEPPDIAT